MVPNSDSKSKLRRKSSVEEIKADPAVGFWISAYKKKSNENRRKCQIARERSWALIFVFWALMSAHFLFWALMTKKYTKKQIVKKTQRSWALMSAPALSDTFADNLY
jgi:hypothetical protein